MTDATYHRTLETPFGSGTLFDADKMVARVRYRLRVAQQMFVSGTGAERRKTAGARTTTGGVEVLDGDELLVGHRYRLELADGRRLHVLVQPRADFADMYDVSGSEPR